MRQMEGDEKKFIISKRLKSLRIKRYFLFSGLFVAKCLVLICNVCYRSGDNYRNFLVPSSSPPKTKFY